MRKSTLIGRLTDSGIVLGAWCMMPGAVAAQAYSGMGYDYVAIDMQHGVVDQNETMNMLQAIDVGTAISIVRVPENQDHMIGRAFDDGASAVVVPMIESADDARKAVAAGKYAPQGSRSYGPVRAGLREGPGYFEESNNSLTVIPMIETRDALRNIDDILTVDGVDIVYVGPFDLSISLGLNPKNNDGETAFDNALAAVVEACNSAGKIAAVHADPKTAQRRIDQGFRMITCAIDFSVQYAAMSAAVRNLRRDNFDL